MAEVLYKSFPVEVKMAEEEGVMHSLASTFGNIDLVDDIIMPGAFDKTLQERDPKDIKFLYQHDPSQPLGVHTGFRVTDRGVEMTSKFALGTQLGREKYELAKMGAFGGVSIGFLVPRGKSTFTDAGIREIHEVKLLEVSLVTFPANPQASIQSVKGKADMLRLIRTEFGVDAQRAAGMYEAIKALAEDEPGDHSTTQAADDVESREVVHSLQELVNKLKSKE